MALVVLQRYRGELTLLGDFGAGRGGEGRAQRSEDYGAKPPADTRPLGAMSTTTFHSEGEVVQ